MKMDREGFFYPERNNNCNHCGLCDRVCPIKMKKYAQEPLECYAAKNKNKNQQLAGASGGIFQALASEMINQEFYTWGGVLCEGLLGIP